MRDKTYRLTLSAFYMAKVLPASYNEDDYINDG